MSGNAVRLESIASISASAETGQFSDFDYVASPTGDMFAENVFTTDVMQAVLSKATYKSVMKTINGEAPLDPAVTDAVASAMKAWAIERGATHFAHVFYPLTGRMANKHDAFYSPAGSSVIAEFSGSSLMQQEPDGSSFPNGGARPTHEARSYTAWDITSPAYLLDNPNGTTLCLPTAFVSWKGETMGMKAPLLRAQASMGKHAARILKAFGHTDVAPVTASGGPEQEYFLIDRNFYNARPDLMASGRTLFGAASAKGQQFDDHYFGIINPRVQACMFEFEREAYKLGIPVATRHNEVAPGQYEIAPVYQSANVAADKQQLVMSLLENTAAKHGFACLLHEKPFAGINGSGKHLNFSIGNVTQGNLFEPGDSPHENLQFLTFCGGIIRAVYKFGPLLRAAIASASNDHRLGANEAPPAILSIFLGDQLADVFEQIKAGGATSSISAGELDLGVDSLPNLPRHAGDRNRTSPFAFTGNKFEFRAVGSYGSIGPALIALNAIMADSFDYIANAIEGADDLAAAVQDVLKAIMDECGSVVFNGDGYSEEWHAEAETRGLANLRTTADALPVYGSDEVVALFNDYGVLSPVELAMRKDVALEQYVMSIDVEANTMIEMGRTTIYPAAARYVGELAGSAANVKAAGLDADTTVLERVAGLASELTAGVDKLEALVGDMPHGGLEAEARYCADSIVPQMVVVRAAADALEGVVADDLWPLPTYQEMLFIR